MSFNALLRLSVPLLCVAYAAPALTKPQASKTYVTAAVGATHFQDRGQVSSSLELTGGFTVLPNFSFEASYLDLGDTLPDDGAYTIKVTGLNFAGKATMPISSRLDFFAKMGWYFWEAKEDFGDAAYLLQGGEDMTYGGGVAWRTDKRYGLSLEYKEVLLTDAPNQQLSLGVTYSF